MCRQHRGAAILSRCILKGALIMKKRIIQALLILCMTLALLPGTTMEAYSGLLQLKPANAVRYIARLFPPRAHKIKEASVSIYSAFP